MCQCCEVNPHSPSYAYYALLCAQDVSLVDGLVPLGDGGQLRRLYATAARVRHFSATLPDDAQHRNSVLIVLGKGVSRQVLERVLAVCQPGGATAARVTRTRESVRASHTHMHGYVSMRILHSSQPNAYCGGQLE